MQRCLKEAPLIKAHMLMLTGSLSASAARSDRKPSIRRDYEVLSMIILIYELQLFPQESADIGVSTVDDMICTKPGELFRLCDDADELLSAPWRVNEGSRAFT